MCTTESTNTYTQMGVEGDLEGGVQGGGVSVVVVVVQGGDRN